MVGKRAHGVKKAEAMDYISGFTLTNDVSAREIQQREVASGSRFWTVKNMLGFAPWPAPSFSPWMRCPTPITLGHLRR